VTSTSFLDQYRVTIRSTYQGIQVVTTLLGGLLLSRGSHEAFV
jgi:hypothetical protein